MFFECFGEIMNHGLNKEGLAEQKEEYNRQNKNSKYIETDIRSVAGSEIVLDKE